MADWSLLPRDLLERINGCFETCFEIVHFRSVCTFWRSAVPPPKRRLGFNIFLPIFSGHRRFDGHTHCILKKIPVFLLRFQTPFGDDCLIVAMSESMSGKQKLMSPLNDIRLASGYGTVLNTLTSQTIPLGHHYEIKFYSYTSPNRYTRWRENISKRVSFLQLNSEDCRDFAVVAEVLGVLMMYKSRNRKWTEIEGRFQELRDLVSFKGKFYILDMSGWGHVFVIDPSLEVTEIQAAAQFQKCFDERLIVSGDELLLVQRFTSGAYGDERTHTWFRLFKLQVQEEGQSRWVRINDLEDRVVFLGVAWNLCYSAKELPGMNGNCVVFIESCTSLKSILVFDFGTRTTSKAFSTCRGYMGAFGQNRESLVSFGIVTMPNPAISFYDSLSDPESDISVI